MFRREVVNEFPPWFYTLGLAGGDWALHILLAERGKIGYIDEVMGAYRIHSGGVYSSLSDRDQIQESINFYEDIICNINFKYNDTIKAMMSKSYYDLARLDFQNGDTENARTFLRKCIAESLDNGIIPLIEAEWQQDREQRAWISVVGIGSPIDSIIRFADWLSIGLLMHVSCSAILVLSHLLQGWEKMR
jgi:hypothetical protein